MSSQVQFRRGTTGQTLVFTGAVGEVTVNTTSNTLVVHDGVTPGGWPVVGTTQAQTLTNKTLYSASLTGTTTISSNLIPSANVTYDLGSDSYRFKDLYLAGTTIHIGSSTIESIDGNLTLTNGSGKTFVVNSDGNVALGNINAGIDNVSRHYIHGNLNVGIANQLDDPDASFVVSRNTQGYSIGPLSHETLGYFVGEDNANARVGVSTAGTVTNGAQARAAFLGKYMRNTQVDPQAVEPGDQLATFGGIGFNGVEFNPISAGSSVISVVQGDVPWTPSSTPAGLVFSATPVGSYFSQKVVEIFGNGRSHFGRLIDSTSPVTGTIVTPGGVGVGGNINVGNNVVISKDIEVGANLTVYNTTFTDTLIANTATIGGNITTDIIDVSTVNVNDLNVNNINSSGTILVNAPVTFIDPVITNDFESYGNVFFEGNDTTLTFNSTNGHVQIDTGTIDLNSQQPGTIDNIVIGGTVPQVAFFANVDVDGPLLVDGVTTMYNSTPSTSTTTGALVVEGGVGIGGNLHVGGDLRVAGNTVIENTYIDNVSLKTNDQIIVSNAIPSTSTSTGSIVTEGGIGVYGDINLGGNIAAAGHVVVSEYLQAKQISAAQGVQNTPIGNATPSTGAFTTLTAGATTLSTVIAASINSTPIGNATPSTGAFTSLSSTLGITGTLQTSSQPNITYLGTLANVTVAGAATLQSNLNVTGNTTLAGTVSLLDTTDVTSPQTGSLKVDGGASFGKNVYVEDSVFIGSNAFNITLAHPTIVATENGSNYAQIALMNTNATASADVMVYPSNYPGLSNDHGWMDMGFTGPSFNQPLYDITKANDGYLFASAVADSGNGGNLVIATDYTGTYNDVVIGVGSFYANAEVARFHGNVTTSGYFQITTGTSASSKTTGALRVTGGAGISGALYAGSLYDNGNRVLTSLSSSGGGNLTVSVSNPTGTTIGLTATGPGVTTVGSSTAIPVITTDAYGRISALSTASIVTTLGIAGSNGTGNVALANQVLTISGGIGISSLADGQQTIHLENTGVTSFASSGSGNLTVSAATGNISVGLTATGPGATTVGSSTAIPVITTDVYGRVTALSTASITTTLSISGSSGSGNVALATQSLTITGTRGVTASASGQTITLDTPQDLRTTAAPTFAGLTATGDVVASSGTVSTSSTTGALRVTGGAGVTGNAYIAGGTVSGAGLLSTGVWQGTYTDGIILDYVDPWGRVSVGATDGIKFYNGGPASTELVVFAGSGNVVIPATTTSTSATTGALVVSGGVGIGGALRVAGSSYAASVYDNSNRVLTSVTSSGTGNLTVGGTAPTLTVALPATGPGAQTFGGVNGAYPIIPIITTDAYGRVATASNLSLSITSNISGTSGSTGAISNGQTFQFTTTNGMILTASGNSLAISTPQDITSTGTPTFAGVTTNGNTIINSTAYISGVTKVTNNTVSSGAGNGALVVTGGAGFGGTSYFGQDVYITGNLYVPNLVATSTSTLNTSSPMAYFQVTPSYPYNYETGFYSHFVGGPANVYAHTGFVRNHNNHYWTLFSNVKSEPGSTTVNFNDAGLIYDTLQLGGIIASNATPSTSTTSGAVVVTGGVGIGGNLNVNSAAYIGYNSSTFASSLVNPVFIGTSSSQAVNSGQYYVQACLINGSATGSADWAAYPNNVIDGSTGFIDMGFTGNTFSDPLYTITKANDGYLFSSAVAGSGLGGNLVLATDSTGTYGDIVLAVGSFYANAEVARFVGNVSDSGYFQITTGTSASSTSTGAFRVTGGAGISGALYAGSVYDSGNRVVSTSSGAGNLTISAGAISLPATGPGATTVGSSSAIPVITTDAYGRITGLSTASITTTLNTSGGTGTGSVALASQTLNIAGGTGISTAAGSQSITITNTGVTALTSSGLGNVTLSGSTGSIAVTLPTVGPGNVTVGSSTSIPVITTDAYGRITALTSSAVSTTISLAGTTGTGSVAGGGTLTFAGSYGVTASASSSTITIGTPQDLRTTAAPTFAGATSTGAVSISSSTASTSTSTGALVVTGGAGIGGSLYVGGSIYQNGVRVFKNTTTSNTAPTNPVPGDEWYNSATDTFYKYIYDGTNYEWVDLISASQPAPTLGAVTANSISVIGGLTAATVTDAGNRVVTSVTHTAGTGISVTSQTTTGPAATVTITNTGVTSLVAGTDITISGATGAVTVNDASTFATVTGRGATTSTAVTINNTLNMGGSVIPTANVTYNVGSTTGWWGTFYGKASQALYADLAENYQADAEYEAGTVLMFGGEAEVTLAEENTRAVAGVVSTDPAYLMNGGLTGSTVAPIALQGRVPCKVVGAVRKGDLMVSAGNGFAKADNDPKLGTVIGKALENFDGAQGVVEVVVGRV